MLELLRTTVDALTHVLDARDPYTAWHSAHVSELAGRLGEQLKLGRRDVELLRDAGSLHDLGKIGIRDAILNKAGPLTDEEWTIMRRHPDYGAEMIGKISALQEVAAIVRHHHEHWNGSGYPAGLEGNLSPFGSRIIAVAESFDFLQSAWWPLRPRQFSVDEALKEISRYSGSWYDPAVVDALHALYRLN